ncbi:MAG: XRE family transcriptional regulator [Clostridia bacterium]|nr:XRE family transcriptional regulator [Clostridia bacterium]
MEGIKSIGQRIKGMREVLEIPASEMAALLNISEQEYASHEDGQRDFTFSFLNKCATRFNMDLGELVTGVDARLKSYSIERKGGGLSVERRKGFDYRHLASRFNSRLIEPYIVTVPFSAGLQDMPIQTSMHSGQEMDYVLEGALKVSISGKTEVLNAGDSIYYDSSLPHGMIAAEGKECKFLAILMKK